MSSYIRVISRRHNINQAKVDESVVDISRTSILGNPFFMRTERERAIVINKYRKYLDEQRKAQTPVWHAVEVLAERVRNGERIALQCWCAPLPCHGDVILAAIEWINNKDA